jgi:divalent metal cation (Fe/Co/Zn/Cd) transporter
MATCAPPPADPLRKAKLFAVLTIGYNLVEGLVSVYFGVADDSVSLLGFGLDSFIEIASAAIVLLKVSTTTPDRNLPRERLGTLAIGVLFLLLTVSVLVQAVIQLDNRSHPETTIAGVVVSTLSISFMVFLYQAKRDLGKRLDSATILADADCSLACVKLSVVLFAGSVLFLLAPGLWWADGIGALVLAVLIGQEGRELIRNARRPDFTGGCGCR